MPTRPRQAASGPQAPTEPAGHISWQVKFVPSKLMHHRPRSHSRSWAHASPRACGGLAAKAWHAVPLEVTAQRRPVGQDERSKGLHAPLAVQGIDTGPASAPPSVAPASDPVLPSVSAPPSDPPPSVSAPPSDSAAVRSAAVRERAAVRSAAVRSAAVPDRAAVCARVRARAAVSAGRRVSRRARVAARPARVHRDARVPPTRVGREGLPSRIRSRRATPPSPRATPIASCRSSSESVDQPCQPITAPGKSGPANQTRPADQTRRQRTRQCAGRIHFDSRP